MGYRVGRVSSRAVSSWSRSTGGCGFRGVFWVGRIFSVLFFRFFFFERTRPAASTRPPFLIYLSTSIIIVVHSTSDPLVDLLFSAFSGRIYGTYGGA